MVKRSELRAEFLDPAKLRSPTNGGAVVLFDDCLQVRYYIRTVFSLLTRHVSVEFPEREGAVGDVNQAFVLDSRTPRRNNCECCGIVRTVINFGISALGHSTVAKLQFQAVIGYNFQQHLHSLSLLQLYCISVDFVESQPKRAGRGRT